MVWTAPMTFVANNTLTAGQLNTHIRDNFRETAPAKATEMGGYFVTADLNEIVERVGRRQTFENETGTTTSTSFGNLSGATVGPQVSVETGDLALVIIGCESFNSGGGTSRASVGVTGASNIPPDDIRAVTNMSGANNRMQASLAVWYDDLTPGTNTFTMRYRVSSGTGNFLRRRLIVLPY